MAKLRVFILNGPNMNLLGTREPGVYGGVSYEQLIAQVSAWAGQLDIELGYAQTNSEGGIVDYIHAAMGQFDVIILNPGAFAHTSYALRDAIVAVGLPVIEVHISNIFAREEWRAKSVIAPICVGTISGLGILGYRLALEACKQLWSQQTSSASVPGGVVFTDTPASISLSASPPSAPTPPTAPSGHGTSASGSSASGSASSAGKSSAGAVTRKLAPSEVVPSLVPVSTETDLTDLANLFTPLRKYEVRPHVGNLGGEVGINEIMGLSSEGSESIFAGNSESSHEDLSPQEREKLKAWMGDDYNETEKSHAEGHSSSPSSDSYKSVSSSDSYKAVSGASMFAQAQQSSAQAQTVAPLGQGAATKRLTIPIKKR